MNATLVDTSTPLAAKLHRKVRTGTVHATARREEVPVPETHPGHVHGETHVGDVLLCKAGGPATTVEPSTAHAPTDESVTCKNCLRILGHAEHEAHTAVANRELYTYPADVLKGALVLATKASEIARIEAEMARRDEQWMNKLERVVVTVDRADVETLAASQGAELTIQIKHRPTFSHRFGGSARGLRLHLGSKRPTRTHR